MTFAGRLIVGTVLLLLVTVITLVVYAEVRLRGNLEHSVRSGLERQAGLVRAALPADSLAWQEPVQRLGRGAGGPLRITLVDPTGRVRAESDVPPADLARIENHAGRPEVAAAIRGRVGVAKRFSTTVGADLMYVAVPGGPGVVRVAMPLGEVDGIVWGAQRSVLVAALLALLLGTALALLAGRSVGQRLAEVAGAARAIAAGGQPRYPPPGIRDVDTLVAALRAMHEQLASRFEDLRRRHEESKALVNAMVEGVIACDRRGRILTANPAARRLLGYEHEAELPALPVLFHEKAAREVADASLRGETVEDREVDLDGRTCLLSARALPGGGAVLVLHDLTPIRRLEAVRRDFVANVSHELKTPLTSISGYAETLLTDRPDTETERRFLETILTNARRMQRLVDDQLDLSRIESGHWRPSPQPVPTLTAFREAWETPQRPSAGDVEFLIEIAPGGETVYADPDALRQVLSNLYDNARRYTPSGGRITASARPDGQGVRLSVSDTGSGIASEHLPRIFERFYRADASRSRAEGGTGLGLSIVRHGVEAHGGRVWAESSLGHGTTIHCWFPAPRVSVTQS